MEKSSVRCLTPRCVQEVAKYGENYHAVYANDNWGKDATHHCDRCGARSIGGVWESRCRACGTLVEPGALVGLFVPHACPECKAKQRAEERARGAVCRMCGKARCDCYC